MADTPLQAESAQANLPSAHEVAGNAQDELHNISLYCEELTGLLYVLAESQQADGSMRQALRASCTLASLIEKQVEGQRQRFEDLWKELPAGDNVATFARP